MVRAETMSADINPGIKPLVSEPQVGFAIISLDASEDFVN
jgi:hypothetical protein